MNIKNLRYSVIHTLINFGLCIPNIQEQRNLFSTKFINLQFLGNRVIYPLDVSTNKYQTTRAQSVSNVGKQFGFPVAPVAWRGMLLVLGKQIKRARSNETESNLGILMFESVMDFAEVFGSANELPLFRESPYLYAGIPLGSTPPRCERNLTNARH